MASLLPRSANPMLTASIECGAGRRAFPEPAYRPGTVPGSAPAPDHARLLLRPADHRTPTDAPMSRRRTHPLPALLIAFAAACLPAPDRISPPTVPSPLSLDQPVRGWIILSDSEPDGLTVIQAAAAYDINHLQISHEIVHDLRHVRDEPRRRLAQTLTDAAHAAGIQEVVLWDRSLYPLDYYPDRFKTGPGGTLDLDDPEFWEWFKQDYREMLDIAPDVQGLILTFIETGARVENQHSTRMTTPQEKLAAVVNAVADVVIGERGLNLYARTFSYTLEEYDNIVGAIDLFRHPEIRLMMKETPHDFFLTHPNDFFAGTIARPTIMEFDAGAEFNGQGLIANTWPQHVIERWSDFITRDHVIGYTARTDRYGDTRLIGRPSEINLYALKRYTEEPSVTADRIYDEFITTRYGAGALPHVKAAFLNAFDIVTSTLYTLGTNTADHSALNHDPYASSYARHVSGKWIDPPVARIEHGVNREFHYWSEIMNHLAPPWAKQGGTQLREVPWVVDEGWLEPEERMNEEYLRHILTEKEHGIALAEASLAHIDEARPLLSEADYEDLHHYFARTVLTARLHRAAAASYFGFRAWSRGGEHRTPYVEQSLRNGLVEMRRLAAEVRAYPVKPAAGQWDWVGDAEMADQYFRWITEGWPAETRGYTNPHGGQRFPLD